MIMEHQKIINFLDNTRNPPTKLRSKNQVEINDDSHGTYNTNSQIKIKTSMLNSSLCDYSDAYKLVTLANTGTAAAPNNREKIF